MRISQHQCPSKKNNYVVFVLSLLYLFVPPQSVAQTKNFGAGIILGEPTGISAKYWVSKGNAVDAGVAWAFTRKGFFHLHADYLWHFPDVIESAERFVLYVGIGGRLGFGEDKTRVGVRIPGGIAFWPKGVGLISPVDSSSDTRPSSTNTCKVAVRLFGRCVLVAWK